MTTIPSNGLNASLTGLVLYQDAVITQPTLFPLPKEYHHQYRRGPPLPELVCRGDPPCGRGLDIRQILIVNQNGMGHLVGLQHGSTIPLHDSMLPGRYCLTGVYRLLLQRR